MSVFLVFSFISLSFPVLGIGIEGCNPIKCRKNGPSIRFPFRDKYRHGEGCGYPGFDLYCGENNETVLKLPLAVKISVKKIDYVSQKLYFYDPGRCLPRKLPYLNLSASPFHFSFQSGGMTNYTIFNCSSGRRDLDGLIPCLGGPGYQIYAVSSFPWFSDQYTSTSSLSSCTNIFQILSVPRDVLLGTEDHQLNWSNPPCGECEARGKFCSLKSNVDGNQTQCIDNPKAKQRALRRQLITGGGVGCFLFVAAIAFLCHFYFSSRAKKENKLKIEKFLKDYEALKPSRFTYSDIRRMTNHFDEKLGEGGYGIVYKGKLLNDLYVAVKVLSNDSKVNGEDFINEVSIIGRTHHANIVRLVGFCAEGVTCALVYEFLQNGSLEKFIFLENSTRNSLSIEKLHDIAVGVAKGIEYLHQGCDQQILHFDIKPHNILLDQNLNPKISDFGLAKLCSRDQSAVSVTNARGTMGYIAPEVLSRNYGRVTYKADIYSYGALLLEMIGGRNTFPHWIYNHLSGKEEITQEDEPKLRRKLAIVGVWCIQWYPSDRPAIKSVLQMLEGNGDNLPTPPNPTTAGNSMPESL